MDSLPHVATSLACISGFAIIVFLVVWYCRFRAAAVKRPPSYSPIVFSDDTCADKLNGKSLPRPVNVSDLSNVETVNSKLIEEFGKWGKLIARDYLADGELVSSGSYASVFKGTLNIPGKEAISVITKVTTFNSSMYTQDFISEATVLVSIDHRNLLPLIGLIFNQDRLPYLVYPFVQNGDLLKYVSDASRDISYTQMIKFSLDIASGMQFLIEHGVFHRNLAARNCFLDDCYNVLVSDFAFSTIKYHRKLSKKMLPNKRWRWQSFEVLDGQVFTEKSDIYSFAVTIWEIFSRGCVPFADLKDNEVKKHMKQLKSVRLDQPHACPDELYNLLSQCWSFNASARPTFSSVTLYLSQLFSDLTVALTSVTCSSEERLQSNHRNGLLAPVPEEDNEDEDENMYDESSQLDQ